MRKIISTILLCLAVVSQVAAGKISFNGLIFSFPEGWSVTEKEEFEGGSYYLSCEKSGEAASGLVTMGWTNTADDLGEKLASYSESILQKYKDLGFTPETTDVVDGYYGTYKGLKMTYTVNLMGVPHTGAIYSFHACGKTVVVMQQEADEDNKANKEGFAKIEGTLECE